MSSLWVLCVLVIVAGVACQGEPWARALYPNPRLRTGVNGGFAACGRFGLSYVCDPDQILKDGEAEQLDILIEKTRNETKCPCSLDTCRNKRTGYIVGIALMENMRFENDEGPQRDDPVHEVIEKTLDQARLFAYTLEQVWGLGQCDEDIVILYSRGDNALYTMTGEAAQLKLRASDIGMISMANRRKFGHNKPIFTGLRRMINDYRKKLAE